MGLKAAIQYGSEAYAIMDATGSPAAGGFDATRRVKGLGEALVWRDNRLAVYE
jgi:hypothetical protein